MIRLVTRGLASITGLLVSSTLIVAGIAAWSSYWHVAHVAVHYGERPEVAYAMPASVDGMLLVASAAMMQDRRAHRRIRPSARVSFAIGVIASIGANIAAARPDLPSRLVAAWPAVALLLVVEMLTRPGRPRTPIPTTHPLAADTPSAGPEPGAGHGDALAEPDRAPHPHPPARSPATNPAVTVAPTRTIDRNAPEPSASRRPASSARPGSATNRGRPAAETYALAQHLLQTNPAMPRGELAAQIGVTPRRLRKVLHDASAGETTS